jgi:hypothetical protein
MDTLIPCRVHFIVLNDLTAFYMLIQKHKPTVSKQIEALFFANLDKVGQSIPGLLQRIKVNFNSYATNSIV